MTESGISLREALQEEIPVFLEMDRQPHARDYIIATPEAVHRENFDNPDIVYLSIISGNGDLAGYFILVSEPGDNVEFRRILVADGFLGIGQESIRQMEEYCWSRLNARRIWLDVFIDNTRGKHIYEKLGYCHFRTDSFEGRKLLIYEKLRNAD